MKRIFIIAIFLAGLSVSLKAQTINPNQIRPSTTNGNCLITVASVSQWGLCVSGNAFNLTTTGTNGAATYTGGVLNIPRYDLSTGVFAPYTNPTLGQQNYAPLDSPNFTTRVVTPELDSTGNPLQIKDSMGVCFQTQNGTEEFCIDQYGQTYFQSTGANTTSLTVRNSPNNPSTPPSEPIFAVTGSPGLGYGEDYFTITPGGSSGPATINFPSVAALNLPTNTYYGGVGTSYIPCTPASGTCGSAGGNTNSSSLTTNTLPKANGANSIVNSSLSDNGTTVSTSEPIAMGSGSTVSGSPICTTTTGCGSAALQNPNTTSYSLSSPVAAASLNMPHWRAALARVKQGTGNARVCMAGDSETAGYLSNNTVGGGTNMTSFNWPTSLAHILTSTYGVPAQWQSWAGDGGQTFVYGRYDINDARIVRGASFNQDINFTSIGIATIAASTSTAPITFTPADSNGVAWPVDTFELYYAIDTTEGTGTANIDGGTAVPFTATGAAGIGKVVLTAGSVGTHTLNVSEVTGTIHLIATVAYNSTTNAVIIINAGSGGSSSALWAVNTKPYSPSSSAIYAALGCDLTINSLGVGETQSGYSPATFSSNMATLLAAEKAGGSDTVLMSFLPQNTTAATPSNQKGILDATRTLASATTQNNYAGVSIPFVDLTSVFISNANGVALGLIQPTSIDSTNTHGTAAGYFTIAKQVAAVIAQTPSTPSSDYAYNSLMNYNPYTGILQSYVPLGSANPAYLYGGGFALTAYMNGSTLDWYAGEEYGSTWRACYEPANKCPLNVSNNSPDALLYGDSTGLHFGAAGAGNLNIFHSLPEGSIVTAASTIVPPMEIFHLTGTSTVNVMTPPAAYGYYAATYNLYSGTLDFVADSATPFAAGTSIGSFATAFTTAPGMTYRCVYTASTGLWYCSAPETCSLPSVCVLAKTALTLTASSGTVTLFTTTSDGEYRLTIDPTVIVADSTGAVTTSAVWTSVTGGSPYGINLCAFATTTVGANCYAPTSGGPTSATFRAVAGTPIQYAIQITGTGSHTIKASVVLEKISDQ